MSLLSWLRPGNDHQLAATQYAGRESASAAAARKRRESHRKGVAKAAKKGSAWEAARPAPFGYRR